MELPYYMRYKNVNVVLPVDLWRKVGIASSYEGKTKKDWVEEVLREASEKIIKHLN